MSEYLVLARKYRPKRFSDVIGQEPIVTTLIHALAMHRVAHAYLFCGPKGTGKTTLARIFSKALNCTHLSEQCEPCNACPSCLEIDASHALDVMEIDGASHRGIEDVRKINETTLYAPSGGKYKIYIVDEVHMLTKEAFNALLKSLEEPPEKVKFLFATTEPHKIPPTILSRCQRFNLVRISPEKMEGKLRQIAAELNIEIEREALQLVVALAGGGLRDAESLLDQLIAFYGNKITLSSARALFGILPQECFAALDRAVETQDFSVAFTLTEQLFAEGKNLEYFLEELVDHFRSLLLKKREQGPYKQGQVLEILELLVEVENQIRHAFCSRTVVEMTLIRIIRSAKRLSLEGLVDRLHMLEERIGKAPTLPPPSLPKEEAKEKGAVGVKEKSRFDTVTRFAAREMGGSLKKEG